MTADTAISTKPAEVKNGEDKIDEYLACIPRILAMVERMSADLTSKGCPVPEGRGSDVAR